jgi:hypothetical protein
MKPNLNNHILDCSTYLNYLYDNNHIRHTNYEKYLDINDDYLKSKYKDVFDMAQSYDINICPYIYTLEVVNNNEHEAFRRYFYISLLKNDMLNKDNILETETIEKLSSKSLEHLITFIITCQYFFL